jgi:hypothetical protein
LPPQHVSVVKRQKTSNSFRSDFQVNKFISEEEQEKEEKEELEQELKKRKGTERADRHEGLYQISDQSFHKRLRKNTLKVIWGLTNRPTDRQTDRTTDRQTDRPTDRQTHRPTDRQTDRPTNGPTDEVSFRGAFWCLKSWVLMTKF